MPPLQSSSLHGPPSSSKSSCKRSFAEPHAANSQLSNPSKTLSIDIPPSKRLKVSESSGNLGRMDNMSRSLGIMSQTEVVKSTPKDSNFQPHTGAKRLVIKNLKTSAPRNIDQYYEKTWAELDAALTAIFRRQQPTSPLEVLCRGVEATCRRGRADNLFKHVEKRCEDYLNKYLLPQVMAQTRSTKVDTLRAVIKHWHIWSEQLNLIRSIFSYLDRSYLLNTKYLPQLEEMGISQFRDTVFGKGKDVSQLGSSTISGMCSLVEYDRTNQEEFFGSSLLRQSISMLHVIGNYGLLFERKFQKVSREFFEQCATEQSTSALRNYIAFCDNLLRREALRCDTYNFDASTKNKLLDTAHSILTEQRSNNLLDPSGVSKLLDANDMGSLKALYDLLCLSKIQLKLKEPWESYIENFGAAVVGDQEKGEEMVKRLLELKRSLDIIVRDAFSRDEAFTHSLREAFSRFINERKNTQAWGTGSSKVGEMIAKYIDSLLRGGLRAVPRSLMTDSIDRDEAEKRGQSSTGDEDAEVDRQLDQGLELFRFIEGKDVFEAFYKKDLARRLLMARSASQDAERNMLAKLRTECGNTFTHNLEQMFKDQELTRDEMISYKQSLSNTSKTTLDLQVNVLSAAAWPTYPDVNVNLPAEVAKHIEKFDAHYKHKHTGRRLTWKHGLAHSLVKAHFNKGIREVLVSSFQAIVLVLFNDLKPDENLSYKDISTATGLVDAELKRTLQSLACAKFRILNKHPKGRDVKPIDTFTVNLNFTDPKYRIKINQIQLKETKEENKETHERVAQDRQYETQAAIVRIMKSRKNMTHANLVGEVINQTKGRGAVDPSEIKKNIEKLIEKDYLERDGSSYTYLA